MTQILRVSNICKKLGELQVLRNVSFEIFEGSTVGLIGPNGAGKTTLFNIINGFIKPDSGSIIFDGKDITKWKTWKISNAGIGRTFQMCKPLNSLTVFENCALPLAARQSSVSALDISKYTLANKDDQAWRGKVIDVLKDVGLFDKMHSYPTELSFGELKNLELGRALVTDPKLLLLDEPFSGLSVNEVENLSSLIRDLIEKRKDPPITIFIIDHRVRHLVKLVDFMIVLHNGEIIAKGSPVEICRNEKVIEVYLGEHKHESQN